jgi:hypothetical protein
MEFLMVYHKFRVRWLRNFWPFISRVFDAAAAAAAGMLNRCHLSGRVLSNLTQKSRAKHDTLFIWSGGWALGLVCVLR